MKVDEAQNSTASQNEIQMKREPFFKKEGNGSFFSKSNQATQPFFNSTIQPKPASPSGRLTIGQPNDKYEVEADAMADQVVQRLSNTSANNANHIQAKCSDCEQEEQLQKKEEDELLQNKLEIQRKPIFESNAEQPEADVQTKCTACDDEEKLQKKEDELSETEDDIQEKSETDQNQSTLGLQSRLNSNKGGGSPLSANVENSMSSAFGADFSNVRVHTGSEAVQMNKELGAQAFTHGSDIYFNQDKYDTNSTSGKHLLAHELTHTVQQGTSGLAVQRHPVAPTIVNREDQGAIFGTGSGLGMTLDQFKRYTDRQADWFVEGSLTPVNRADLWKLLLKTRSGSPVLSGVGDVQVNELRTVTDAQWIDLETYCRGCHSESHTVRITRGGSLASRISLGNTLKLVEVVLPGEVLEVTITHAQLQTIHSESLVSNLTTYWTTFHPHLQETVSSASVLTASIAAGSPTTRTQSESQLLIDFLRGPNIAPFSSLLGKVRNLHRFAPTALKQVQTNFTDFSRTKPVYLLLYSGHDHNAGFAAAQSLFENLMRDRTKLVLMLEGQGSLQEIINKVPDIARDYGQPDASGVNKIAQVMIAGHGGSRNVELAGTGSPDVRGGEVHYTTESLDLDNNNAQSVLLLQTLMDNMDPATARVVYAGCLVGSTSVPINNAATGAPMTAADISSHVTDPANQSLADFTRQIGTASGLSGMTVEGGRGSVGLSASHSLQDAAGNMHIDYRFDPAAFANALTYLQNGREPEGVMRAAVQIAATNSPIVAANQLRLRSGRAPVGPWFDTVTNVFVNAALDGVAAGAGIDIVKVNKLSHMAAPFFHSYMTLSSIGTFGGNVNIHGALARQLYIDILAIPYIANPASLEIKLGRFIMEMGWALMDPARATNVIAYLDSRADLTPSILTPHIRGNSLLWLDSVNASANLFPAAASATNGRIRLALAWIFVDNTNADVRAFLDNQVDDSGSRPRLKAPVISLLNSPADEDRILEIIGRLTPTVPPSSGSGPSLDPANADAFPNRGPIDMNDVRIEPNVYVATVVAPAHVLNVRTRPSMRGTPFHWLRRGDTVNVMGFVHNWAGVDINGKLGFVHKNFLSPPP